MSHSFKYQNRGFTLVELLVTLTIVLILFTVILFNQSTYSDNASLTNIADQISLNLSEVRSYSIGVKELSPGSNNFKISYGLTFSLLSGNKGSNSSYLRFADRDSNQVYDGNWTCATGGAAECLEKVPLTRNNTIESICIIRLNNSDICNIGRADISFARPHTEAQLKFFNNGGNAYSPAGIIGAKITLVSPKGLHRVVTAYSSGQISVQ